MENSRPSSTASSRTMNPNASSRSSQEHNHFQEVRHADSSRFRPWLPLDEELKRPLVLRPCRHSPCPASILGLVYPSDGDAHRAPADGGTPQHAFLRVPFLRIFYAH